MQLSTNEDTTCYVCIYIPPESERGRQPMHLRALPLFVILNALPSNPVAMRERHVVHVAVIMDPTGYDEKRPGVKL